MLLIHLRIASSISKHCVHSLSTAWSIGGKSLNEKHTALAAETIQEGLPNGAPVEEVLNYLEANYNDSTPCLVQIFVAVMAGKTQTYVECLFSVPNRIDTPHHRDQLSTRQPNLRCSWFNI